MKIKIYYIILLIPLFLSCNSPIKKEDILSKCNDNQEDYLVESNMTNFNFSRFQLQLDSLLAIYEDNKYFFDYKLDTINPDISNEEFVQFKNGLFSSLLSVNLEMVIIHYFSVPEIKKILRIYFIEAQYSDNLSSKYKIDMLKNDSQTTSSIEDSESELLVGLTMTNDFLCRNENKIYWLNISCQYSKKEYLGFVGCFKDNLKYVDIKDTIICFCEGNCEF